MTGFGLLLGHLLGDYILQNDWQAKNKANDLAGKRLPPGFVPDGEDRDRWVNESERESEHRLAIQIELRGHLACTVHCLLYTLAVWACSFWWMPWWGLLTCFLIHWPIDRFRLARKWMWLVGQEDFATGRLSPWSVVVVDNTFHLLTLLVIALAAGVN